MTFADELAAVLPPDLPHRDDLIQRGARHLELIEKANQHLNLTRITEPREAAIKHVLDSVLPWRLFAEAQHILDAGSGAGFPGVPLALVLPQTRFTLAESVQKKARFLDEATDELELGNAHVRPQRAEELLKTPRFDLITARAMAPLNRAVELFAPAIRAGSRALFYKGPDVEAEIAKCHLGTGKRALRLRVIDRYELPDSLGTRTIVELSR